jgi:GDPmannose 4,6-dehydratase
MYSQEMSGVIVDESSLLDPQNFYAKTKAKAFSLIKEYRHHYEIHCSGAILFNHTSNRSKPQFLFPQLATKITQVLNGVSSKIIVRDPDAEIDISDASEVCEGLISLGEIDEPTDIVFASGNSIKIRDLISITMNQLGFRGTYTIESELGAFESAPKIIGNPEKALRLLNWKVANPPEQILIAMIRQLDNASQI